MKQDEPATLFCNCLFYKTIGGILPAERTQLILKDLNKVSYMQLRRLRRPMLRGG